MPDLKFAKLEIETLARLECTFSREVRGLSKQLAHARPVSRENTGAGFFTEMAIDQAVVPPLTKVRSPLNGPVVHVGKMLGTLGTLLFVKNGYVHLLEGYSLTGESTASIGLFSEPFKFLTT